MLQTHTLRDISSVLDATLLAPEATSAQMDRFLYTANTINAYGICVLPKFVSHVSDWIGLNKSDMKIVTVIGFPTGGDLVGVKSWQATLLADSVHEFDFVPDLENIMNSDWESLAKELRALTSGSVISERIENVKLILETGLLNKKQIAEATRVAVDCGFNYVKTSTGTHPVGGATVEAIEAMLDAGAGQIKVKASGGISSVEDAEKFIALGVHRLGSTKLVSQLAEIDLENYNIEY